MTATMTKPTSTPRETDIVSATVLVIPERCYRCGAVTRSVVGFLVPPDLAEDPNGFVEFEDLAHVFASRVTAAELARSGIGPIKVRRSRLRPEGYLSNGCIGCDAIQGAFPLHEALMEFLAEGGEHRDLIVGRCSLPRSAVASLLDRE